MKDWVLYITRSVLWGPLTRFKSVLRFAIVAVPIVLVGLAVGFSGPRLSAATAEPVHASHGIVASRSVLASEVGVGILERGGNAIDAAVATEFALAVTHPSAGNLAGGGFMVIRLADGRIVTNDNREVAPKAASRDMYLDAEGKVVPGLSTQTHLAVGVPGTVDGLLSALKRFGSMDRKQVIAPALQLAEQGFALNYDLGQQFKRYRKAFSKHAATLKKFTHPDGTSYREGEIWKQPDLAASLKRIMKNGRAGFYGGKTAELIVAEMKRGGGLITQQDLTDYHSVWRHPIHGTYRGYDIYSMPPPSSGGVLLVEMLNMLEPYDIKASGFGSAATMHLMIEAERRAYADRAKHLGDSDFYPVPLKHLLSKQYARDRFASFDPKKASDSNDIGSGFWPSESVNTTHLSTLDAKGNAVAYTTTLNLSFGSKIVAEGTGILLNDEMDDFSSKANTPNSFGLLGGKANAIEPGKRMLSSMSPTIVTHNGEVLLVTGSPGGSTIITTVLQVMINVLDHGMDISDAVGRGRFHHQWKPDVVLYEPDGFSPDTLRILIGMGHKMRPWKYGRGIGDANSIMRVENGLEGTGDVRNPGGAVGF